MFLIYYLLHYILGLFVGLTITGMIYPSLRILPTTIGLISQTKIKKSALYALITSITFWCLILVAIFFIVSYLKPITNLILNFGFIFGFISVIFFGWLTPSAKDALQQDYGSFFGKYLDIPDNISPIHLDTAKSIIYWINDTANDVKQENMNLHLETLSFTENDEVSIISALRFLDADSETIYYATEMLNAQKQQWEAQIELEKSNLEVSEMRKSLDENTNKITELEKGIQVIEKDLTGIDKKKKETERELEDMVKSWFDESE